MNNGSFYESTQRHKINSAGISAAQRSYTFNYLSLLPSSRDARIVDLGCSEGISLEWLVTHGYKNIIGVDSDPIGTKVAKEKLKAKLDEDRIICMDALAYMKECEDSSVDMVAMFNVIEHIPKNIILDMMVEIKRVLKEGGQFLAQTGNWENPFNTGLFTRDFTHEVMYTKSSLRQLMVMSGFPVQNIKLGAIRYKTTARNLPLQILAPVSGWLLKALALSMRIHISETAPIIYCYAKNPTNE